MRWMPVARTYSVLFRRELFVKAWGHRLDKLQIVHALRRVSPYAVGTFRIETSYLISNQSWPLYQDLYRGMVTCWVQTWYVSAYHAGQSPSVRTDDGDHALGSAARRTTSRRCSSPTAQSTGHADSSLNSSQPGPRDRPANTRSLFRLRCHHVDQRTPSNR